MTLWVRIRSWHAFGKPDALGKGDRTLCGRVVTSDAETDTELPAAKSCENCLRIIARKAR